MKNIILFCSVGLTMIGCSEEVKTAIKPEKLRETSVMDKSINKSLPTIGILIFEGVIINEVVAPLDVFSNSNVENKPLFNVVIIAKEKKQYSSAHGLKITPDFTIDAVPDLKVLVVPSSYTPSIQTSDEEIIEFIKEQNKTTDYIASHCAGAFLIGEAGIANDKQIVTYVTGGELLKLEYPNLKVVNDDEVSVVQDGKFISSNGSLVSYIASFDLLEKLTSKEHRKFVETAILFDRIKGK